MEEDVEACVEAALKEGLLRDWGRMAVGLLGADESCEEVVWWEERARVNPPRPSCVGNRIIEVGRPCSYQVSISTEYGCGTSSALGCSDSGAAERCVPERGLETVSEKTFSFVARASSVMIHDESSEATLWRTSARRPLWARGWCCGWYDAIVLLRVVIAVLLKTNSYGLGQPLGWRPTSSDQITAHAGSVCGAGVALPLFKGAWRTAPEDGADGDGEMRRETRGSEVEGEIRAPP
jgi:hypothetical protein